MLPPIGPILIEAGPFAVHWYGLLIVTGIVLAAISAAHLAKAAGQNPDHIWDMLLIAVIFGVIGARLYHVFSTPAGGNVGWDYYRQNPIKILYVWEGGLGIFGAILGGALGVLVYTLSKKLRPLQWMDFGAPGLALGQTFGRWGNYMNRELYGPPTTLPWGIRIPQEYRIIPYTNMSQYPPDTLFQPLFLYESLGALIIFLVLFWLGSKHYHQLKEGDMLVGYLIGYSSIRFFTEMLRPDAWRLGQIAAAQVFSIGLIVVGLGILIGRRWWSRRSKA